MIEIKYLIVAATTRDAMDLAFKYQWGPGEWAYAADVLHVRQLKCRMMEAGQKSRPLLYMVEGYKDKPGVSEILRVLNLTFGPLITSFHTVRETK